MNEIDRLAKFRVEMAHVFWMEEPNDHGRPMIHEGIASASIEVDYTDAQSDCCIYFSTN